MFFYFILEARKVEGSAEKVVLGSQRMRRCRGIALLYDRVTIDVNPLSKQKKEMM